MADVRLDFAHRKAQILATATRMAEAGKLYIFTLADVADEAECSDSLVKYHYTLNNLRFEIIRKAIEDRTLAVVAQVIACHDPMQSDIPDDLRQAAARHIAAR